MAAANADQVVLRSLFQTNCDDEYPGDNPDDDVLKPDSPSLRHLQHNPTLEVFLVQSKNAERWEESVWERLLSSLDHLLNAGAVDTDLEILFRPALQHHQNSN